MNNFIENLKNALQRSEKIKRDKDITDNNIKQLLILSNRTPESIQLSLTSTKRMIEIKDQNESFRYSICKKCPSNNNLKCVDTECFIEVITSLTGFKCPQNKW